MTLTLLIFKMLSNECDRACQSILTAPCTEDSAFTYDSSLFYIQTLSVARCSCRPLVELAARTRCSLKEAHGENCVPRLASERWAAGLRKPGVLPGTRWTQPSPLAITMRTADFRGRVLAS